MYFNSKEVRDMFQCNVGHSDGWLLRIPQEMMKLNLAEAYCFCVLPDYSQKRQLVRFWELHRQETL